MNIYGYICYLVLIGIWLMHEHRLYRIRRDINKLNEIILGMIEAQIIMMNPKAMFPARKVTMPPLDAFTPEELEIIQGPFSRYQGYEDINSPTGRYKDPSYPRMKPMPKGED